MSDAPRAEVRITSSYVDDLPAGHITHVIVNGKKMKLESPLAFRKGSGITVMIRDPLPKGWPRSGATDRVGWAWCVRHEDCHVSLSGDHVKRGHHPCVFHKNCCVKDYVHIPWSPKKRRS